MTSIFVRRDNYSGSGSNIILEAGKNLETGGKGFTDHFGSITTLESDLLLIAASIFAADRFIPRGEREDYMARTGQTRPIYFHFEGILGCGFLWV